jgi:diguanylate cyclase (GGDEF)-like protein
VPYALAVVGLLLVVAGYLLGSRRREGRETALRTSLEQRSEQLTLVEQELQRKTSIEPVTALPTQQYFQDFLEREWRRASRERAPVSLVLLEVDHFSAFHDHQGKAAADTCLRAVADALRPRIHRPSDTLAQYGGAGKFGLVLGGTHQEGARVLAERLREAVEKLKRPNPVSTSGPTLTVSIGVATMVPDREGAWQDIELIAAAERALAEAKEAGRNRVTLQQTHT